MVSWHGFLVSIFVELSCLFVCLRSAELVAAQRLEAAERRKMEEKERRVKQVTAYTADAEAAVEVANVALDKSDLRASQQQQLGATGSCWAFTSCLC